MDSYVYRVSLFSFAAREVRVMGMVEKSYRSGEVICKEGESGKSFFMLLEGTASVYADYDKKDPLRLAVLEAGEFFGEMAIIEDYPRNATVVAKTNARAVEIPRDELKGFFTENPDLIVELMRHIANRIEVMTGDLNNAHGLLEELRASDEGKKKSLFSKIKKHMDIYQNNKNKIEAVSPESLKEARKIPKVTACTSSTREESDSTTLTGAGTKSRLRSWMRYPSSASWACSKARQEGSPQYPNPTIPWSRASVRKTSRRYSRTRRIRSSRSSATCPTA